MHLMIARTLSLFVLLLGGGCSELPALPERGATPATVNESIVADVIYTNASIWRGLPGAARAQAIAVRRDSIVGIGAEAELAKLRGPLTRSVDLGGAFVVPGFIDNHTHFLFGGFALASVQLRDASTPDMFTKRIADFAETQPSGGWIEQGDWDHELWGGTLPHRDWIDAVTPENPVSVTRLDGHMSLVNGLALKAAGITAATVDPEGGEIVRDASGEPTGVLKDTAMTLVTRVIAPPSLDAFDQALAAGMQHAIERGITQIHDVGNWDDFAAFRRARARGALDFRVYSLLPIADWWRVKTLVETEGRGDDLHRWGGVKGLVDGSLGSTTAWFYDPYDDAPDTSGFPLQRDEVMRDWILSADAAGLQVAVHAIGDKANDRLLDAFEAAQNTNGAFTGLKQQRRFRIEHAQHQSKAAFKRFAELGVVASMQPFHAIDDGRWAGKRMNSDRISRTYAFKSFLDAGATLTFGSDWTVAPIDPLQGIYAAVTRRTIDDANPQGWVAAQKISVEQALHAYTSANAWAGYGEDQTGTLEVGKLADFVVLSADLFDIDPLRIPQVQVLRTVIGGEEKFLRTSQGQ